MKHLLTATDFSDGGNNAVAYAAALARGARADLHLFHAYKAQSSGATVFKGLNEILEKDARDGLAGLLSALQATYPDLTIKTHVAYGDAVQVIPKKAIELAIDLVVIGTKGKSTLDTIFFGSTSVQLGKETNTPVLMVPPGCSLQTGSVICYASALREQLSDKQVTLMHDFASAGGNSYQLLHVYDKQHPLTEKQKARFLELQIQLGIAEDREQLIYNDDAIEAITHFVRENSPSAIALHQYQYGFLERLFVPSVSRELMQKVKVPMLMIPMGRRA